MGGLAKGLSVIRAFTREAAALNLTDVATITKLPPATARRCLLTLEELGYVTRNGRQFVLRPKVLELGAAYLESMNIEQLTKTHLEALARDTGDSAALCVLPASTKASNSMKRASAISRSVAVVLRSTRWISATKRGTRASTPRTNHGSDTATHGGGILITSSRDGG